MASLHSIAPSTSVLMSRLYSLNNYLGIRDGPGLPTSFASGCIWLRISTVNILHSSDVVPGSTLLQTPTKLPFHFNGFLERFKLTTSAKNLYKRQLYHQPRLTREICELQSWGTPCTSRFPPNRSRLYSTTSLLNVSQQMDVKSKMYIYSGICTY